MKRFTMVLMVVMMVFFAGSVMAATLTPQVNVTATVTGKCDIVTASGAMDFSIDPAATGPFTATVNASPVIRCTKSHPYTVGCTSASGGFLAQGANTIPYTFSCPANGSGAGFGNPITMAIGGQVSTGFADAPVGNYSDTVTITVTY
jgi:spore coat protein U-like protein